MKKRKLLTLGLIAMSVVGVTTVASCGGSGKHKKPGDIPSDVIATLDSITVTGAKTSFTVGDTFVSTGLVTTAHYSDGKSKTVTGVVDSSLVDNTKAGTYTITVTFEGKSATYDVVYAEAPIVLDSITVSGAKTTFTVGDAFVSSGLVTTAHYSDGSTKTVTGVVDSSLVDNTKAGTYTITVTFEDKSVTYDVVYEAAPVVLESISVSGAKNEFYVHDTFVSSGLVTTAHYSDGSTKTVTGVVDSSLVDNTKAGTYTITVTFGEKSTTYDVVYNKILTGITLDTSNAKLEYYLGDDVSFEGLIVKANYDGADDEIITATTNISRVNKNVAGEYPVIVTYNGESESFIVKYVPRPVVLESITVKPKYTSFYVDDIFTSEGLVTTAHYSDGSTKTVTGVVDSNLVDNTKAGTYTITVTFEEKSTTYSVTYEPVPVVLERIEVDVTNAQVEYYEGDVPSKEGVVVTAYYSDGSEDDVTVDSTVNFGLVDINNDGTYTVNVSYEDKMTSYEVTIVKEIKVEYVVNNDIISTKSVSRGDEITSIDPEVEGYELVGWYDNAALTIPHDFDVTPTESCVIYAKIQRIVRVAAGYLGSYAFYTYANDESITIVFVGSDDFVVVKKDSEDSLFKAYSPLESDVYEGEAILSSQTITFDGSNFGTSIGGYDIAINVDGTFNGTGSDENVTQDGLKVNFESLSFMVEASSEKIITVTTNTGTTKYVINDNGYATITGDNKTEVVYNDLCKVLSKTEYTFDGTNYIASRKKVYQYDEKGNQILDQTLAANSSGVLVVTEYIQQSFDSYGNQTVLERFENGRVVTREDYVYYHSLVIEGSKKELIGDSLIEVSRFECIYDENDLPSVVNQYDSLSNELLAQGTIELYEDGNIKKAVTKANMSGELVEVEIEEYENYNEDGEALVITETDLLNGQVQKVTRREDLQTATVEIYVIIMGEPRMVASIEVLYDENSESIGTIQFEYDPMTCEIVAGSKEVNGEKFDYDVETETWVPKTE